MSNHVVDCLNAQTDADLLENCLEQLAKLWLPTRRNELFYLQRKSILEAFSVQFGLLSGHLLGNSCPLD